jgi:peptide/nickel transport system substrate-binding protein
VDDPDTRAEAGAPEPTDDVHIRTFLIADVRGYTLFTQERGDEAAGKLAAKFAQITREGVEGRGGTLLELRGDEALCVFGSPRQAIRAAVELQERFVEETLADSELPLTVGIGLDAGEAVAVEGGYRGGALNLAARLCGQARAGEILASREVAHLARRVEGARYEDRGALTFKGIADPIAVVRVVGEGVDAVERLRPYAPVRPPEPRLRRRPWPTVAAAALAVVLVAVVLPLLLSEEAIVPAANSVARFDLASGEVRAVAPIGARPGASTTGFGSLWIAQPDRGFVVRADLVDGSVTDTIRVGASPAAVAAGEGSVWVANGGDGTISRISPDTNEATQTIDAGSRPTGIAVGSGAVWVADSVGGQLLRVDPASGAADAVPLAGEPSSIAFTSDGVWLSTAPAGVVRVDPADLNVTLTQSVGSGPTAVVAAFGSIWVANHLDATVSRLDPSTGRVVATIAVGDGPNALAAATGSLWVANEFDGSVTAIDPDTNDAAAPVPIGASVASLATDGEALWLAVGASAAGHRGGTLRIASQSEPSDSLDPAVAFHPVAWQLLSITNDGLLAYRKVGGPDGTTLVPDLASALPEVSADGRTYRFTLREGISYSTGEPVRPEDFTHAFERVFALKSDAVPIYRSIEGSRACTEEPTTCDLSRSVVAEEGAVTFHLARPDPDFAFKLALTFAFPVPEGTPFEDQRFEPVPATGPYTIVEATSERIEVARNPSFREWSAAAQPDGSVDTISWTFGEDRTRAFDEILSGELDWIGDPLRPEDAASLQAAHPDQVVLWPQSATFYVGFDVRDPPFDDARVRQAVNLAIDRNRAVEFLGGPASQRPTCQIFPPNFQGYEPFCPHTLEPESGIWSAPDPDRARALVEDAGAVGEKVAVWITSDPEAFTGGVPLMRYLTRTLDDLGLRADLKIVRDVDRYAGAIYAGEAQIYLFGWISDFPRAVDYIEPQFTCGGDANASGLCDEDLDRRIEEAKALQATDPAAANRAWIAIEHGLVEDAIWAPIANPVSAYAFSARAENIQVHPQWGILLSRLWVR